MAASHTQFRKLDPEQEAKYREIFQKFDSDGSGSISPDELRTALIEVGSTLTPQEIKKMVEEFDTNGDGQIDFQEFLVMVQSSPTLEELETIKETFRILDADKTGHITLANLKAALAEVGSSYSEAELLAAIAEADTDGDGQISLAEFQQVVKWV